MNAELEEVLRENIMKGKGDEIRNLFLNSDQIKLVKLASNTDYFTSAELAVKYNISIQNASAKLKRLCDSGYLQKLSVSSESGGIEYHYKGYYRDKL